MPAAANGGTPGRYGGKKYIHWKESQMEVLSKYLQAHVDYATAPSLEKCYLIKRDVFQNDDEVTPKRLFGKICNMRAAFRRSGGGLDSILPSRVTDHTNLALQDDAIDLAKKKRRRRHSHMDSIYYEHDINPVTPGKYAQGCPTAWLTMYRP